jgi:O-antigen ligase
MEKPMPDRFNPWPFPGLGAVQKPIPERFKPWLFLAVALCGAFLLNSMMARFGPSLLLPALLGLEALVFFLWSYRARFFVFLIVVFLAAGMELPLAGFSVARWVVLAAGALAGLVLYVKQKDAHFGFFHFVAISCVLSALVSALVSTYPEVALLKVASLALLFLYAACGARLAVRGREAEFLSGLLLGTEILVYFSAGCYFVLHYQIYGNPNSLGAIMGVVATPVLLWGVIISEGTAVSKRRTFALVVCLALLLTSYARAAIAAAVISSLLLCIALRSYRLLAKGVLLALVLAAIVIVRAPRLPGEQSDSLVTAFIYKGDPHKEILDSRQSRWDWTMWVIRRHPWFGSGFGTSPSIIDVYQKPLLYISTTATTREHGNSYLAMLEWLGILGVLPFYLLVLLVAGYAGQVWRWARRTANPFSPALPIAMILIAGLVHAAFEDWMFAVGYYLSVFFWALAFALIDIMPATAPAPLKTRVVFAPRPWSAGYGAANPGR